MSQAEPAQRMVSQRALDVVNQLDNALQQAGQIAIELADTLAASNHAPTSLAGIHLHALRCELDELLRANDLVAGLERLYSVAATAERLAGVLMEASMLAEEMTERRPQPRSAA